jgi:GNAT superfamily N-acetyltransferase
MTTTPSIEVRPLQPADRAEWEALARGYRQFYNTPTSDAEFDTAWRRLLAGDGIDGLGAVVDGRVVGIAHFLFHSSTWAPSVCYLQDLFTTPELRRGGIARRLIEAVAAEARQRGATRYYWLTQDSNSVARGLYDQVGRFAGFLRYDYDLASPAAALSGDDR